MGRQDPNHDYLLMRYRRPKLRFFLQGNELTSSMTVLHAVQRFGLTSTGCVARSKLALPVKYKCVGHAPFSALSIERLTLIYVWCVCRGAAGGLRRLATVFNSSITIKYRLNEDTGTVALGIESCKLLWLLARGGWRVRQGRQGVVVVGGGCYRVSYFLLPLLTADVSPRYA